MAQILHVRFAKFTLFQFSLKFMFAKLVKHLAEVRLVLILVVAKNENVVQIHQNKVVDVPMHNGVHKMLEGTWCIAEPKRQNRIFK